MTDRELDALYEAETDKLLEEYMRDDRYYDCMRMLEEAEDKISRVEDLLLSAAEEVDGIPESDRIMSLMRSLEDIEVDVRQQRKRMQDIEREAG